MLEESRKSIQQWALICYGNILRSQVLEHYLRYYANERNINISFFSAGIAGSDEFPDEDKLYGEIHLELQKRNIPHTLYRNAWDEAVAKNIAAADIVICADNNIRTTVIERMHSQVDEEKVFTFYGFISEGEKDFEDTYDYENQRQDPIRFRDAFNELDRIAGKILDKHLLSLGG